MFAESASQTFQLLREDKSKKNIEPDCSRLAVYVLLSVTVQFWLSEPLHMQQFFFVPSSLTDHVQISVSRLHLVSDRHGLLNFF